MWLFFVFCDTGCSDYQQVVPRQRFVNTFTIAIFYGLLIKIVKNILQIVSFCYLLLNSGFGRCLVYRKHVCQLKRYANQVKYNLFTLFVIFFKCNHITLNLFSELLHEINVFIYFLFFRHLIVSWVRKFFFKTLWFECICIWYFHRYIVINH